MKYKEFLIKEVEKAGPFLYKTKKHNCFSNYFLWIPKNLKLKELKKL